MTVVATRYLILELNWHHPSLLLLLEVSAAAIVSSIARLCGSTTRPPLNLSLRSIFSAALASVALLVTFHAMLLMQNPASMLMTPLLVISGQCLIDLIKHASSSTWRDGVRVLVALTASVVIWATDHQRTATGDLAMFCVVVSVLAFRQLPATRRETEDELSSDLYYACSIVGTFSAYLASQEDVGDAFQGLTTFTVTILSISIMSGALVILSGRSFLVSLMMPTLTPHEDPPMDSSGAVQQELAWLLHIVPWSATPMAKTTYMNMAQLFSFVVAMLVINGKKLPKLGLPRNDMEKQVCKRLEDDPKLQEIEDDLSQIMREHDKVKILLCSGEADADQVSAEAHNLGKKLDDIKTRLKQLRRRGWEATVPGVFVFCTVLVRAGMCLNFLIGNFSELWLPTT